MFNVTVSGLDELQNQFKELAKAIDTLNGQICEIKVNPDDPADIQRAIREVEDAVNSRISAFRDNPLIVQVGEAAKGRFREQLLQRIEQNRINAAMQIQDPEYDPAARS